MKTKNTPFPHQIFLKLTGSIDLGKKLNNLKNEKYCSARTCGGITKYDLHKYTNQDELLKFSSGELLIINVKIYELWDFQLLPIYIY